MRRLSILSLPAVWLLRWIPLFGQGGTWIAYGGGDADKEVVDSKGHIAVPLITHNTHYEEFGLLMKRKKGFTTVFQ